MKKELEQALYGIDWADDDQKLQYIIDLIRDCLIPMAERIEALEKEVRFERNRVTGLNLGPRRYR